MENVGEKEINVVIVEDNILTRITLKKMLNFTSYINVCADFDNAEDCINYVKCGNNVDLVIMDAILPNMSGVEASNILKKIKPGVKILMLTADNGDGQLMNTLLAQADAYFIRDFSQELLNNTITRIMKGFGEIDRRIQNAFVNFIKSMSDKDYFSFTSKLTQEETRFLALADDGFSEEITTWCANTPVSNFYPYLYSILNKTKNLGLFKQELKYDVF